MEKMCIWLIEQGPGGPEFVTEKIKNSLTELKIKKMPDMFMLMWWPGQPCNIEIYPDIA